ncbi:hypothetical protein TrispH2_009845 [Trichoplax sp. H2]|nr:hypothetical protein TrispH2_009845 [Trichoplax sp. H2]|eukprot:RDD38226.1 hypothetical protein TrispH2_009845 [Trichoplax sp. H2]
MKLNKALLFAVIAACLFVCVTQAAGKSDEFKRPESIFSRHLLRKRSLSTCSTNAPCTTTQSILCTKNSDCCCDPVNGDEECILHVSGNCLYVEAHPAITTGTCQVPVGC